VAPALEPRFPTGLTVDGECPEVPAVADSAASQIPLRVGLTLSHTWTGGAGDYDHECLVQVVGVTDQYVDVTQSCPYGADHRTVAQSRRVCRADMRDAYFYSTETGEKLPRQISPSTMFSLSAKSFRELKTGGRTRHRYIEFADAWRGAAQPLVTDIDETLGSGRFDRETYRVLINSRDVDVAVLTAIGNVSKPSGLTELKVLDDEQLPLVLEYQIPERNFHIRYTKISYPGDGELERRLTRDSRVDVYGLYFDFASDRLRPESTPLLADIAAVMTKNAQWKLTINGHTDSVGTDASNLILSQHRAQAVMNALVQQYRIAPERLTTGGFGASQPQAKNDTPEGRARNRRVELIRH
jgi:outer membrane protein OmpA-like peptidoglycan-associated protein